MTVPALAALALVLAMVAAARRKRSAHQAALTRTRQAALAPTIDLLTMTIGAGGTPAEGIRVVARQGPAVVRPAFAVVLERQQRGQVLAEAVVHLTEALGPEFHPLVTALVVTDQGGAPIGGLLQRLADEAEHARRRSVELMLARLPVTLLVPLVICQLPAVVIGAVVPLTIVAFRHLGG